MSAYRELAPSREKYSLVACRWMRDVDGDDPNGSTLVLPDGCIDFLWRDAKLVLAGLDRTARRSPLRRGERILGLRLRPGVAGAVLGIPASEVLDQHATLEEVLGRQADRLTEDLGDCTTDDEAFALLEEFVASGSRVDSLADSLGISDRQLRRRFRHSVGYGPKTLDRVLRFRRFVSQTPAVVAGDGDLARIAADLGYADQAHMSRDCRRLSGLTPTELATTWSS